MGAQNGDQPAWTNPGSTPPTWGRALSISVSLSVKRGHNGVPVWHDGLKIESMHVKSESSTRPKPQERARWRRTALPPLPPAFMEASGAPGHAVLCVASCITFVHPLSKQMGSVPVGTPDSQRNHFEKRRFSDGPCC